MAHLGARPRCGERGFALLGCASRGHGNHIPSLHARLSALPACRRRTADCGKLPILGVTIACIASPIVTRMSSQPRWLFLRLVVVVTR